MKNALKLYAVASTILKMSREFPLCFELPDEDLDSYLESGNMCPHTQVFVSDAAKKQDITDAMVGPKTRGKCLYTTAYMSHAWKVLMPDAGTRLTLEDADGEFSKVFEKTVSQEKLSWFVCGYLREIYDREPADRLTMLIPTADELHEIANDTGTGLTNYWLPGHCFEDVTSIRPLAEVCMKMDHEAAIAIHRDDGVITSRNFLNIVRQFDTHFSERGVTGYYVQEHGPPFLRNAYNAVTITDEGNPFVYQENMSREFEGLHVWYRKFVVLPRHPKFPSDTSRHSQRKPKAYPKDINTMPYHI